MKSIRLMMAFVLVLIAATAFSQTEKTDTFKVYGNCDMCKYRIEKTVKRDVIKGEWNPETKMMTVTYDAGKISNDDLQKKIAAVGHDTEKFKAEDKVYKKLPGCCLYDRKKEDKTEDHSGHKH